MNNNINFLAFGTFGNPNGFRQTVIGGNSMLSKNIKTFDLNTNAIKLFPSSKVYSLRKEFINNQKSISYSIYTYAKEQNSDRSGTFIGSCILYQDLIADELITIKILNDFHKELVSKNVIRDVITVNHSDNFSIVRPIDIENIEFNLKKIGDLNFQSNSNNNLIVYTQTSEEILKKLFSDSLELLNIYDIIYFTDSLEVAKFSQQKKLFKVIQLDIFNKEIENFKSERKAKIINSINEFDNRIQELDRDREQMKQDFSLQIQRNISLHQENASKIEESKRDLEKVLGYYDDFSKKIKELNSQLNLGKNPEKVRALFSENKRIFINSIDQLKRPSFVNHIQKAKAKSNLRVDSIPSRQTEKNIYLEKEKELVEDSKQISIKDYFTASNIFFGLIILLVFVIGYVLFSTFGESSDSDFGNQEQKIFNESNSSNSSMTFEKPNGRLTETDCLNVKSNLSPEMKINEVVDVIIKLNPNEVGQYFSDQKSFYSQILYERNKDCFKINNIDTVLKSKESLDDIPNLVTGGH